MRDQYKLFQLDELSRITDQLNKISESSIPLTALTNDDWVRQERVGGFGQMTFDPYINGETSHANVAIVFSNLYILPRPPFRIDNYENFLNKYLNEAIEMTKNISPDTVDLEGVSKIFMAQDRLDKSYIFRLVQFIMAEARALNPSYIQNFWFNPEWEQEKYRFMRQDGALVLNIHGSFFLECFFAFTINYFPVSASWKKENGFLWSIYRHHYIQFGDLLRIEHSWQQGIRWRIAEAPNPNTYTIESSQTCGIPASVVFKRAIARFSFSLENPYLLFRNNCEHLGTFCFYGSPRSRQVRYLVIVVLAVLIVEKEYWQFLIPTLIGFEFIVFLIYSLKRFSRSGFISILKSYGKSLLWFPR